MKLTEWLASRGFLVETVGTGEDALQMLANFQFDVLMLDWELPGISGLDVCRQYRLSGGTSFIIFLTGKGDISNKEQGLEFGADDYLVKPFDSRELVARIRSLLRRPAGLLPNEVRIGDVLLNPEKRILVVNGASHPLTQMEAALLEYLMRHPNRIFGSKNLLDAVWPSSKDVSTDTVRSWMRNLRKKLEAAGQRDLIKTIPGSGYIIDLEDKTD